MPIDLVIDDRESSSVTPKMSMPGSNGTDGGPGDGHSTDMDMVGTHILISGSIATSLLSAA